MTEEKMNVHRALCELKTLDSRIANEIASASFAFPNKHGNSKVSGVSVTEKSIHIKGVFQSVKDLIARRDAIKRAVTSSNASQTVVINGNQYTVAEAIETKNHFIPLLRKLMDKLEHDLTYAYQEAEMNNGEYLERRADEYVKSLFGNTDAKGAGDEIQRVRNDFIAAQTVEVVDPINISAKIKELSDFIDGFMVEVDSALSVSNAITEIKVSY